MVLSGGMGEIGGGGSLLVALSYLGVETSPVPAPPTNTSTSSNTKIAQLQSDELALQTELNSLSSKSGVTVADLTTLLTDAQALGTAWRGIDPSALQSALSALVNAAAAGGTGADTSSAAFTGFTGLFPADDATQAAALANDIIKIVQDSGVSTTDLSAVATDQQAVQTDLSNLPWGGPGWVFGGGMGLVGGYNDVFAGGGINDALSRLGVLTNPVGTAPTTGATSSNSLIAQLQTDQQALQTELNSLSSKSAVTVADLTQLLTDSQALGTAWRGVDRSALQSALSALVNAAAAGGSGADSSSSAFTNFTGLFPASDATLAAALANDIVKIVQDSGVSTTDLSTVASDQQAIQTDLSNLHHNLGGGDDSGNGSGCNTTSSTTSTTSGSSTTSTTTGSTGTTTDTGSTSTDTGSTTTNTGSTSVAGGRRHHVRRLSAHHRRR